MTYTMWMLRRLMRSLRRRRTPPKLAVDGRGFTLGAGINVPEPEFVAWQDVRRVVAFKRDCYIVDSVRLHFEHSPQRGCEVFEELEGWEDLVENLPWHLPGCETWEEWFPAVALSAFEPSPRVIFER